MSDGMRDTALRSDNYECKKKTNLIEDTEKSYPEKFLIFCMNKVEFDSRESTFSLLGRDDDDQLSFYTLDDLFTYWKEEVKDK